MKEFDAMDFLLDAVLKEATIQAVEELAEELPKPEPVEFSKQHQQKMKAIFRRPQRQRRWKKISKYSQRIVVVLLVAILVSGATIFSVEAWRVQFLNFIISIGETNTDISFTSDNTSNSHGDDTVILGYIPSGFELTIKQSRENYLYLDYQSNGQYFMFSKSDVAGSISVDTENAVTQVMKINGHDAFLSVKENVVMLVWHDTINSYKLGGNIDIDEIIRIAECVQRVENDK